MEKQKGTWGGVRENSGRKAAIEGGTVSVNWRVSHSARIWLKEQAEANGTTIGVMIDLLIEMCEKQSLADSE